MAPDKSVARQIATIAVINAMLGVLAVSPETERSVISRVDISRIESGQIDVTLRTMRKLAEALDLQVSRMLKN